MQFVPDRMLCNQPGDLVAQLRAQQAASAIRSAALERELNRLTLEEIEVEIRAVRTAHLGVV